MYKDINASLGHMRGSGTSDFKHFTAEVIFFGPLGEVWLPESCEQFYNAQMLLQKSRIAEANIASLHYMA